MRSKKGFTLIELLAVIVILAVIALIATPIVLNIIEKAKKSAFLDSAYGIIKSGENYYAEKLLDGTGMIEDKTFLFDEGKPEELRYSGTTPNGGTITITKEGKVGIAIHNGTWCATKSKDTSEVTIAKYEDGKCLIPDTAKDPVITLNGKKMISLKQGAVYQEEGAIARTVDGTSLSYQTEITKNGVKVNSVDSSVIGTVYMITYTADSNGKKASVTRTVTIVDGTAPIITFDPETVTLKVNEVANYNIYTGVTIKDNVDGPIEANKENVKTTGELKAEVGEQTITYEVKDKVGNIATKIRTFNVVEAEGPILNFSSVNSGNKWVKAQNITVTATDNSNLSSFTYEVFKNGASQGVKAVTVSGKSASTSVALSQDGTYTIKLKAADQYGSSSETTSGTYKIDVTKPTISMSNVTIDDTEASTYNLMTGVNVSDNSGIMPNVKYTPTLLGSRNTYTVVYTVVDEAGNVTTANRIIIVGTSFENQMKSQASEIMANDPDRNLRYVGKNPNNYVWFNNELWRIIGVFNGQAKIIRNEFLHYGIAWDENSLNNWEISSLQKKLNGTYLNSIEATSKSYIDQSHVWNLGGVDEGIVATRSQFYTLERSSNHWGNNPEIWIGAIGLMYASDWAYASSSLDNACDNTVLGKWNQQINCYSNSWLHSVVGHQWTLTHSTLFINATFTARTDGLLERSLSSESGLAFIERPALFLKSGVKILSGTGTSTDPFILTQ